MPTKGKDVRNVPLSANLRFKIESWIKQNTIAEDQTIFFTFSRTPIDHDNFSKRIF